MIPIGQEQHLGQKAFILILLRRISGGLLLLLLFIFILFISKFLLSSVTQIINSTTTNNTSTSQLATQILSLTTIIIFVISIVLIIIGIIIAILEYKNYSYQFNEFDLIMRTGILDKKETIIPYRQIQDINIDRPLFYQIFGLSNITLKSSGAEEAGEQKMTEINIEPIDKNISNEIQIMLERKIGVQVVEDEVKADKESKV